MRPLKHNWQPVAGVITCVRCRVERDQSGRGSASRHVYRRPGGEWSNDVIRCSDPRQTGLFDAPADESEDIVAPAPLPRVDGDGSAPKRTRERRKASRDADLHRSEGANQRLAPSPSETLVSPQGGWIPLDREKGYDVVLLMDPDGRFGGAEDQWEVYGTSDGTIRVPESYRWFGEVTTPIAMERARGMCGALRLFGKGAIVVARRIRDGREHRYTFDGSSWSEERKG
jgi:hypothetical protein